MGMDEGIEVEFVILVAGEVGDVDVGVVGCFSLVLD